MNRHQDYHQRNKAKRNEYQKNYTKENPIKIKAKNALNQAIRSGKIERGTECSECGTKKHIVGHHWSYEEANWLDVLWVCQSCHRKIHAELDKLGATIPGLDGE